MELAHAGDGSGRLFIVEQAGRIKILEQGAVLQTLFLDLTDRTALDGERGLLGLAFHPQYAANRRFYVFYTRTADGALQVSEFLANASNPDVADPASERPIIAIPHASASNHNGGRIAFGPDGYLYVATGDGGGGGDPADNAQNKNALLGKLLRLDVNTTGTYLVPPGNPFVGQDGADEIWSYGLRNPWKFGFDRLTGDLFIADVGQAQVEEVNFAPFGEAGGRNYGWDDMEGSQCFEPPTGCNTAGKTLPIIEYSHAATGGTAVIGGYVYRGRRSAALRGFYVYGDLNITSIFAAARNADGSWTTYPLVNGPGSIIAFGEDEAGELYVANFNSLYALDGPLEPAPAPVRADLDGDRRADVFWRHQLSGETYAYLMNGTTIAAEGYVRTVAESAWKVVGIGDFDGDGNADVLWRNSSTGQNYIYFMDGIVIKPGEGFSRTVADDNWTVAGVGDFNGDDKDDILWRNVATGENYLWPMEGLAILPGEGYIRTVADMSWKVAGVGDLDGDGKADIVWRNSATGQNYLYPMLGTVIKPSEGFLRSVVDQNWQIAGVGDFTGDGKHDLLWRHASTGENYLYPMVGTSILASEGYLRTVAETAWKIVQCGDFDGDGKSDILWRNSSTGENYIYPMDGTSIKATEGFLRTVQDQNWRVVSGQ